MVDVAFVSFLSLYILSFHIIHTNSRTSTLWKLNMEEGKIIEGGSLSQVLSAQEVIDDPIFNIITSTVHYGKSWTKRSHENNYCTDCQHLNSTYKVFVYTFLLSL
jgi:hypothetical protein